MIDYFYLLLPVVVEYRYLAVFTVLVIAGLGVPIPEELSIVISGYLVATGRMDFWLTLAVCYAGVLAGDLVTYFLGRYAGRWFLGTPLLRLLLRRRQLAQAQYYYRRYGPRALLLARQAPGIRFPAFFTAGMLKMRLTDFLLFDSMAGLISMPLAYLIAYFWGPRVTQALALIVRIGDLTTFVVIALILLLVVFLVIRYISRCTGVTDEINE